MKRGPLFPRKLLKGAFKKFLQPSLAAIKEFLRDGAFKITLQYVDSDTKEKKTYEADINLTNRDNKRGVNFEISIKDQLRNGGVKYMNSYGLENGLHIYTENLIFTANAGTVQNFECNFPALPRKLTGFLNHLQSQCKPYDNSYYRMCIPVTDTDIIYPTEILSTDLHLVFDVPLWDMQPSLIGIRFPSIMGMCITLDVRGKKFHFYAIEDIKCVFIDSLEKLSFDEFQSMAADIRLAFAFLTAKYYSGDVFTLISKDKHFRKISDVSYQSEGDPIYGKQQLINPTELFTFYRDIDSETFRQKFSDFHNRFSKEIFGRFCTSLYDNPVLRRATEILVNSCSTKEPLQQGILGSVALETITELIAEENKSVIKPISEKSTARALIKRLKDVVKTEFETIPQEGSRVIESKLSDLNKPTNKSKLLFPFQMFGIILSEIDEEILNYRNDFLHGRSPINHNKIWELEQIALKLHYLAGVVILKYIGYSGHVINLPFWNLFRNQEKMLEHFPVKNEHLKMITETVEETSELSDDDLEALKVAGQLSMFLENLIRLI